MLVLFRSLLQHPALLTYFVGATKMAAWPFLYRRNPVMTSVSLPRLTIIHQIKQGFGALSIVIFCLGFLAGCGERISEHGHIINQAEMDTIKIGKTNRADIIGMLGQPSFEGAFDSRKIYYASQIMELPVAGIKKTKSRVIYAFSFDTNNSLKNIDLIDEKSGLNVTHIDSKTPTTGDTLGFVEQIFLNLKRRQANE
tara:strand:+ start:951 stop:1541 length:591 start_codon:yes stop_codon:yes gene_type:complete